MGFFNTDNSWFRKHDIFLRKGSLIVNYMIDRIENDKEYQQIIRRLCRYMTKDPLAMISENYSGERIKQPDLKDSLLVGSSEGLIDIRESEEVKPKPCLYNGGFNQEIKTIEQCYVFIHNYRNNPVQDDIGRICVRIDIIVPNKYDMIYDFDSGLTIHRGDALCFLLDDLFNHRVVEDEIYEKYIGNLRFKLEDNYTARLTKTSDGMVYSLIYSLSTPRGEILNGNI